MPKLVKVRLLKEDLIQTYGEYMHRALEVAVRGQAAGIWEIVDDVYGAASDEAARKRRLKLDNDAGDPTEYMTRAMFARPARCGIKHKDLGGGE